MNKEEFQQLLGRKICDQTWYRLVKKLREHGIYKQQPEEYSSALKILATINRGERGRLCTRNFKIVWHLLNNESTKLPERITGEQIRDFVLKHLENKPVNSTFYRWFTSVKKPFRRKEYYNKEDLIIVISRATMWDIDTRQKSKTIPRKREQIFTKGKYEKESTPLPRAAKIIQQRLRRKNIYISVREIREFYLSFEAENNFPPAKTIDRVTKALINIG